jgi:ketosteroid isomerase-like protein
MANLTQIVQGIYGSFGRGDVAAIVDSFADDIRFLHPGGPAVPYAKDRRGKAEATAFFAELAAAVEVTAFVPQRYVEQGDTVVALGTWAGRARSTGRSFDSDWAMVWTFAAGKVRFFQAYEDTKAVAQAFAK